MSVVQRQSSHGPASEDLPPQSDVAQDSFPVGQLGPEADPALVLHHDGQPLARLDLERQTEDLLRPNMKTPARRSPLAQPAYLLSTPTGLWSTKTVPRSLSPGMFSKTGSVCSPGTRVSYTINPDDWSTASKLRGNFEMFVDLDRELRLSKMVETNSNFTCPYFPFSVTFWRVSGIGCNGRYRPMVSLMAQNFSVRSPACRNILHSQADS